MSYHDQGDCTITRDASDAARLHDVDGTTVFLFPAGWTDEQIWLALELANQAFNVGVNYASISRVL